MDEERKADLADEAKQEEQDLKQEAKEGAVDEPEGEELFNDLD